MTHDQWIGLTVLAVELPIFLVLRAYLRKRKANEPSSSGGYGILLTRDRKGREQVSSTIRYTKTRIE